MTSMINAPLEISLGTLIDDRYRIHGVIGQGGFGRTYFASDEQNSNRICVLKEFLPNSAEKGILQKSRKLFEQEAIVLQQLTHPQIPQFLNNFEADGRLFIVQEYIDGRTYWDLLSERRAKGQVFSEAEVMQLLLDLLGVLDYIHGKKIIHRDISPDNIMFSTQAAKPVLIDFGVVKQVVTQLYEGNPIPYSSLPKGSLVGKVGYSPPEQILMGRYYPNSDLYSLAVTALVLLTGKKPEELFDSYACQWEWKKHISLSDGLTQILDKMLAQTPRNRYPSARDVLAALSIVTSQAPTQLTGSSVNQLNLHDCREDVTETALSVLPRNDGQTTSTSEAKKIGKSKIIALGILGVLLVGSIAVVIQLPHIPVLCKTFDECAKDKEFRQVYEQAIVKGTEALTSANNAKNTENLQDSLIKLTDAIAALETIPNDVKIYPEAQQTLENYRDRQQELDERLAKEKQAEQQLAALEAQGEELSQQTQAATTIDRYKSVKALWEARQTQLEAIPADIFASDRVKTQLDETQQQMTGIQGKIDGLIAQERERQRLAAQKAAAQKAAAQKAAAQKAAARQSSSSSRTTSSSTTSGNASRSTPASRSPATSPKAPTQPNRVTPAPKQPPLWGNGSAAPSKPDPLW